MKSVGATNAFVRIPFIIEGIVLGIISALLSYGIVYFIYSVIFDLFGKGLMGGMLGFSSVWYIVIILFSGIAYLPDWREAQFPCVNILKDEGGFPMSFRKFRMRAVSLVMAFVFIGLSPAVLTIKLAQKRWRKLQAESEKDCKKLADALNKTIRDQEKILPTSRHISMLWNQKIDNTLAQIKNL